jgi:hypothetical protein
MLRVFASFESDDMVRTLIRNPFNKAMKGYLFSLFVRPSADKNRAGEHEATL